MTDVTKIGAVERYLFIEMFTKHTRNDNLWLLKKLRDRIYKYLDIYFIVQTCKAYLVPEKLTELLL